MRPRKRKNLTSPEPETSSGRKPVSGTEAITGPEVMEGEVLYSTRRTQAELSPPPRADMIKSHELPLVPHSYAS